MKISTICLAVLLPLFALAQLSITNNTQQDDTVPEILGRNSSGVLVYKDASTFGGDLNLGKWDIINGLDANDFDQDYISFEFSGANNKFVFNQDGSMGVNIGIDDIPFNHKLAVRGTGIMEDLRIRIFANWNDYVFESDYDLLPLDELQCYLEQNKHLPNVPSKCDLEAEGDTYFVGRMLQTQLEKIEELTLYILQLHDRIKALEEK